MKTVLIADDSYEIRTYLIDIIHSSGAFKVEATAQNGLEAINLYKKTAPTSRFSMLRCPKLAV